MKRMIFAITVTWAAAGSSALADPTPDAESLGPEASAAPTQRLNFDEALGGPGKRWSVASIAERAVTTSHQVSVAEAHVSEARAQIDVARVGLLPRVSMGARYTRLSKIDNDSIVPPMAGLGELKLDVPQNQYAAFGRIAYPVSQVFLEVLPGIRASEGVAAARRYELSVMRSDVALQTIELYLSHARARAALAVADLTVTQAGENLARADALLKAESGTRTEVLRFSARLAEAEREKASTQALVRASANALRTLLDLPGEGPLAIGESLASIPKRIPGDDLNKRVEQAWQQRDEVAAASSLIASLENLGESQRGARLPTLAVAAGVDYANPNQWYIPPPEDFRESWNVSVIVQWSPDASSKASREAKGSQARLRAARAGLESLRTLVRIEVVDAHTQYVAAFVAMEATIRQLEAAEAAYDAQSRGYEVGVTTATALLDAEVDANRARLALIDTGVSVRLWEQRLLRASGDALWRTRQ